MIDALTKTTLYNVCSVLRGISRVLEKTGGVPVPWGISWVLCGDIMRTVGKFIEYCGGYSELHIFYPVILEAKCLAYFTDD